MIGNPSIYIAAPSEGLQDAKVLKNRLIQKGFEVTSRWIEHEDFGNDDPEYLRLWSRNDLQDVAKCDLLILLNDEKFRNKGTGGRHVEFGYAVACGKVVWIVGERTNIFHWGEGVLFFPTVDEALKRLES